MNKESFPAAVLALDVAPRTLKSHYPEPYASMMDKRVKRTLGELFGLKNFGVNLTQVLPGGVSALKHAHAKQDEFIYIISGHPVLQTDAGDTQLAPGMVAGFAAGGTAHRLTNPTQEVVTYLEVGDRTPGDEVTYPDDDIAAKLVEDEKGKHWAFFHKDGTPY